MTDYRQVPFDWNGHWITDAAVDETGRYPVGPLYYRPAHEVRREILIAGYYCRCGEKFPFWGDLAEHINAATD